MNRVRLFITFIAMLAMPAFILACATVQPTDRVRAEVRGGAFAKAGDTVHLFYGMSSKAKEEFCPDSIVPVYRMGDGYVVSKTEVGKIKVTKNLGDHFIEAVVVEGTVRPGDIAMQSYSGCFITLPQPAEKK